MVMTVISGKKKAGVILKLLKALSVTGLKILKASGKLHSNVHNVAAAMVVLLTSTIFTPIQATENPLMDLKATNILNLFTFYT